MAASLQNEDFVMPVADVFLLAGRGVVLLGPIESGVLRVGESVEVLEGERPIMEARVKGIEGICTGDPARQYHVGLVLDGVMDESPFRSGQTVIHRRAHLTVVS